MNMFKQPSRKWRASLLAVALLATTSPTAFAQVTTGTIRGDIGGGTSGVSVTARNVETGFSRTVQTGAGGAYVFPSLPPGSYEITADGKTTAVRLQVGQSLVVDLGVTSGGELLVSGQKPQIEVITSEVGTNVSKEQIDLLPQSSRNFLNFAALAPGVRVSREETRQQFGGGATNSGGDSLAAGQTNVFIDGVSLKSNIQQGGLVGQDSSRGNPFSQLSIQEFKVLTQNFRAEYEQSGSSVITAVTKSGTNQFHGDVFGLFARRAFQGREFFDKQNDAPKPAFSRNQFGADLGGPIIKDKLFFYVSYEGNFQDRAETVRPNTPTAQQLAELGFNPQDFAGTQVSPFREHLGFAKLNWNISDHQLAEATFNIRKESDIRDFGGLNALERANNIQNDVKTARFKHQFDSGNFLNEFSFDWLNSVFLPTALNPDLVGRVYLNPNIINLGGQPFTQRAEQTSYTIRDNVTLSDLNWHGRHLIKTGFRLSFQKANVLFGPFNNPEFRFQEDPTRNENFSFPFEAVIGLGAPTINANNTQFGAFVQDDWDVTDKLQVNLGLRWDIEFNPNDNNYVTPAAQAAALRQLEINRDAANAAAAATGATLAPDAFTFHADDYISNGNNRPLYFGQFQPRIGFSYDVFGDKKTVLFAGWGRFFDRTLFRNAAEESVLPQVSQRTIEFSLDGAPRDGQPTIAFNPSFFSREALLNLINTGQAPGGEIRVLNNNQPPPRSDQFSIGVRQKIAQFQTALTYSHIRSIDDISYFPGNRLNYDLNNDGALDFIQTPNGFGTVVASAAGQATRFNAVYVTIDKPYTPQSHWGFDIAYTLSYAKQRAGSFNFDFINPNTAPFVPNGANERHRIVISGIADLPYGFQLTTLTTLATGQPFLVIDASQGFGSRLRIGDFGDQPGLFAVKTVDARLQKNIKFEYAGGHQVVSLYVEANNIFNTPVYTGFNNIFIPVGGPVPDNLGEPNNTNRALVRTVQFGAKLSF